MARHEGTPSNDIKIRTLLVDDQPSGISVLRNILRFEPDIEIIGTAANGLEAIESINRLAPDLVFLDVQMPGADGFGVVAKIELPRAPIIIFVTADRVHFSVPLSVLVRGLGSC